mmetsp:Transcript_15887/g.34376  ORF Transcript_15887/g.34376 Transcript_15887/m.34376 type:complete len:381 (+) Transcript_15887:2263-3405(+)
MTILERLLGHITQNQLQWQIHRSCSIRRILDDDLPIPRDCTQNTHGTIFTGGNLPEECLGGRADEEGVVFLVFGSPDFEDGECVVTNIHLPNIILGTRRLHNLLQHISISPCTLIMHTHNRILRPQVTTGPHQSVHAILHLSIPPLHGIKVQCCIFGRLHTTGSGTSPDTNAVAWSTNFNHQHALRGGFLGGVSSVHGANACREHDGFDPFESLSGRNTHAERAGKPVNDGLTEFIPIVTRSITGFYFNLQRSRQIGWIFKLLVFPRKGISRYVKITNTVSTHSSDGIGSTTSGHDIPQSASGTGLGSGEGSNGTRKVVSLRSQNRMQCLLDNLHLARIHHTARHQGITLIPPNTTAVIMERNNGIVWHTLGHGGLYHFE